MNQKKMKKMNGKKTRLIDANALVEFAREGDKKTKAEGAHMLLTFLRNMVELQPTVDAEPVRHGKWIETREFHGVYDEWPRRAYACSKCRVAFPTDDYLVKDFRYCPNCGARMDK